MENNEKPKEIEFKGNKVRFYYQDIEAYAEEFLKAIIWYQKDLIEELGNKLNQRSKGTNG